MSEEQIAQQLDDDFEKYFSEITTETTDESAGVNPEGDPATATQAAQESGTGHDESVGDPQDTSGQPAGEPSGQQGADGATDAELEALKKQAHGYDSMKGRLDREQEELRRKAEQYEQVKAELRRTQEERRRMDEELARMQGARPAPQQEGHGARQNQPGQPGHQGQTAAPLPMAEIPEEIKEEADAFAKDYPDLTPLLRYPGREGEKLRKLLSEYGPDVAAIHGQAVMAQYQLAQSERKMSERLSQAEMAAQQARQEALQQIEQDRKTKHYAEIGSRHPEVQWIADPNRKQDYAAFRKQLDDWVMDRPYREAQHIQHVLAQGTAPEVVALLDTFKQSLKPAQAANGNGAEDRARLAQAAAAVPTRPGVPKPGNAPPPRDDFSAAWQEAVRN